MTLSGFLNGLQKKWKTLTKGTVWLALAVMPLLGMPAGPSDDQNKTWTYLASFLLAFGVGLVFLVANRRNKKRDVVFWAVPAACLALLGTTGFVTYQYLKGDWTTKLPNGKGPEFVVGTAQDRTPDAIRHTNSTPAQLIKDMSVDVYGAGGIWNRSALQRRWMILAIIRVPSFQFFGLGIVCLAQAIICVDPELPARGKPKPRRRTPRDEAPPQKVKQEPPKPGLE